MMRKRPAIVFKEGDDFEFYQKMTMLQHQRDLNDMVNESTVRILGLIVVMICIVIVAFIKCF